MRTEAQITKDLAKADADHDKATARVQETANARILLVRELEEVLNSPQEPQPTKAEPEHVESPHEQ